MESEQIDTAREDSPAKKKNMIKAEGVKVWYDDFMAIKGIDMKIRTNRVTAFIGPSGCGKSTFLRLLNRMNDYIDGFRMEGAVLLDDQDIYDASVKVEELRKAVGMVFQKPNPFPKSIFENVAYGLKIQSINDKEFIEERVVESLMQATLFDEVKDELNKPALALSGGQQQRLCIARVLAV